MEYREIVAVTGLSGLYQLLATKSDGAIVRNLADKATKFISARMHSVTPLESIEVYTTSDNVRLHEIFQKMKEQEETTAPVDTKADAKVITHYFQSIFPELDTERVYASDMKKMLKWYELLKASDLLNFEALNEESEPEQEAGAETEAATNDTSETVEAAEETPAKKARAKKPADTEAAAEGEEKPKKVARKKKAEGDEATEGEEAAPKKTARKKKTEE